MALMRRPILPRLTPDEVKQARETLGLTQQALADALGLDSQFSKDTVRSWENGMRAVQGPESTAIRLMLQLHKIRPPKPAPPPPPPPPKRPRGRPRKDATA